MRLSEKQLSYEIHKCLYCEDKPCKDACPVDCSPCDFLMAAKLGNNSDYERAAVLILGSNPIGGVCGAICPDRHCMKACTMAKIESPVNITDAQQTIIEFAREKVGQIKFRKNNNNGSHVAIVGSGPAGLGAAAVLAQLGYKISIFEKKSVAGGALRMIPNDRLDKKILDADIEFIKSLGDVSIITGTEFSDDGSFQAVLFACGLEKPIKPDIHGADKTFNWIEFLNEDIYLKNKRVAVIGSGAVALDCCLKAKNGGAVAADLIMRKDVGEMELSQKEFKILFENKFTTISRTSVTGISDMDGSLTIEAEGLRRENGKYVVIPGSLHLVDKYDIVVFAMGTKPVIEVADKKGVFYAGDLINGNGSAVEAVASGKNAAKQIDEYISHEIGFFDVPEDNKKSRVKLNGRIDRPVDLSCEFFGRKILSPFLLSAAPCSDGYLQMKLAYEAGWAGAVMKTVFDGIPIHIPSEYMFKISESTYGNCDNVSHNPLEVTAEIATKLINEFPDRLTMVSTGGPVTGNDDSDKRIWQSNTVKLEKAGVMGIEYSLSCPQGGDGTEGNIVSQNPALSAKIVDWVMEISNPDVPKLFKLTGAVTSIIPIINAIKKVFDKYPDKKAGVTLANSFPALAFRENNEKLWDEGIVVGLSGDGVKNISNRTLADASVTDVYISGNGGPMDYKAAADFMSLGAGTVQFCTAPTKYGVDYIKELELGLSYYMKSRGIQSIKELTGIALPNPVTEFDDLSGVKKISDVDMNICIKCGNCKRCPYVAISWIDDSFVTDASRCIGCSICAEKCPSGAIVMRKRTESEAIVTPNGSV